MDKINKIGELNMKPTIKITQLTIGQKYKVTKIKKVESKFGQSVLVELDGELNTFLPKRYSVLEEKDFLDILESNLVLKEIASWFGKDCAILKFSK